jgi:hypothetical protein
VLTAAGVPVQQQFGDDFVAVFTNGHFVLFDCWSKRKQPVTNVSLPLFYSIGMVAGVDNMKNILASQDPSKLAKGDFDRCRCFCVVCRFVRPTFLFEFNETSNRRSKGVVTRMKLLGWDTHTPTAVAPARPLQSVRDGAPYCWRNLC